MTEAGENTVDESVAMKANSFLVISGCRASRNTRYPVGSCKDKDTKIMDSARWLKANSMLMSSAGTIHTYLPDFHRAAMSVPALHMASKISAGARLA